MQNSNCKRFLHLFFLKSVCKKPESPKEKKLLKHSYVFLYIFSWFPGFDSCLRSCQDLDKFLS